PHLHLHSFPTRRSSDLKLSATINSPPPSPPFPSSATSRNINSATTFPALPVLTQSALASISSTNRSFAARLPATSKQFSPILRIDRKSTRLNSSHGSIS